MDLVKPTRIGAYDIIDVIGRGGMGTVFRGNDPRIGRAVAIKVLTAAAEDPDLLIRFYREAKYTGSLHHQNIVTVYELGHQDGVPYLVMEFLEGVSLEGLITSGRPMPVAEKLGIILQVCNGLTYAHKHGLIHRDIKPANVVILSDGTAKIVDFGIALLGGSRLTRTGHVVGSLNYMSPEQLSGNVEVDARTDVYSTGVVMFQLLTGVLPFDGGSTAATLRKIVQDPPPKLSQYMKDCPEDLDTIAVKALTKNREERYPSPEDFALDLARVHQQYLKKLLGETLQQAADALQRKDYSTARQQVIQVLRAAPQNLEAAELLKQVKAGQEQHQHTQQVLQLQMKAEEAFRKNQLDEAMQFVEQGIKLDPNGAVFPGLKEAIGDARIKMGHYREALTRAEVALKVGDLAAAKKGVEAAQAILPDDTAARSLAGQIVARLDRQMRERDATDQQKQLAVAVNAAEKRMADVRMLLLLGQLPQALQALNELEADVAQLPTRWVQQFEALKKEVHDKRDEQNRTDTQELVEPLAEKAATPPSSDTPAKKPEAPAPTPARPASPPPSATAVMQPGKSAVVGTVPPKPPVPAARPVVPPVTAVVPPKVSKPVSAAAPPVQTGSIPASSTARDVLYPRTPAKREAEKVEVAPELREFLQPEPSNFPLKALLLGAAVLVVAGVIVWVIMRPSQRSQVQSQGQSQNQTKVQPRAPGAAGYTYAEINAEPWATVTAVSPANGEAQSVVGQATPLRVKLPPGQYSVTLRGPNHEEKKVNVTVPQQGGAACFAVFKKPDLKQIVGPE
ncbi:MAG TPA: serine/threonine-protein kinase [Candidatus Nitrosotalea sp.]|nr:serine/threonine-protein kinase [Candidatus Nitrosotalea sp.]